MLSGSYPDHIRIIFQAIPLAQVILQPVTFGLPVLIRLPGIYLLDILKARQEDFPHQVCAGPNPVFVFA
tara:strand:- start:3731 stop:3937 length:207 start_codon:yes stop_codon:yes gene_type:complete